MVKLRQAALRDRTRPPRITADRHRPPASPANGQCRSDSARLGGFTSTGWPGLTAGRAANFSLAAETNAKAAAMPVFQHSQFKQALQRARKAFGCGNKPGSHALTINRDER